MNGENLQRFPLRERGKNAWKAARQHRLPCSWRPDEQHVVAARCGDFQRALGCFLSNDICEIRKICIRVCNVRRPLHTRGRGKVAALKRGHEFTERRWRSGSHALDERGFARIWCGHYQHQVFALWRATLCKPRRNRKYTAHCTDAAVEAQLSKRENILDECRLELARCGEVCQRNRQVECGALLSDICRGQIDCHAPRRHREPGVQERGTHPLTAFPHRPRRQANDGPLRQSMRNVHLDGDVVGLNSKHSGRTDGGEHREGLCADVRRMAPFPRAVERPVPCQRPFFPTMEFA